MAEGSARILLVDDEHAVQKLLAYPLRKEGYEVVPARDGREALDRFAVREFRSRVKAALPRSDMLGTRPPAGEPIVAGALGIDFDRRSVMVGDRGVRLTYVEFEILAALAADSGRVHTREMLLERVWGDSEYRDPRTIDVHIRRMREKIERDPKHPEYLFTVRGAIRQSSTWRTGRGRRWRAATPIGRADHPYPARQRLDPYPGRNSDLRHDHAGGRDRRARRHRRGGRHRSPHTRACVRTLLHRRLGQRVRGPRRRRAD
jgi:hypothetical protein